MINLTTKVRGEYLINKKHLITLPLYLSDQNITKEIQQIYNQYIDEFICFNHKIYKIKQVFVQLFWHGKVSPFITLEIKHTPDLEPNHNYAWDRRNTPRLIKKHKIKS